MVVVLSPVVLDQEGDGARHNRCRHRGALFDSVGAVGAGGGDSAVAANLGAWGKGYFWQGHRLAPYVRAGAGVYNVNYNYDVRVSEKGTKAGGSESAGKFGMNGGLGVAFAITRNTALGVEGLYHQVMMRGTDVTYWSVAGTLGFGPGGK